MKYRKLGKTGIEVSAVCMGCWAIVGDTTWGPQDEQAALGGIHTALDAGINFFDTAEGYGGGDSERILAKGLAGRREQVVIGSKVNKTNLTPDMVREHCEASLRHLETDYIDLYQIHWPHPDIPIADTLGALEQLKTDGKVRAIGVSNFGVSFLAELLEAGRPETDQLNYSLLWRPIEHTVLPMCREHGIGVLCYSPLCQGLLTGKFASADDVPEGRARTRLFSGERALSRHGEPGCEEKAFAAIGRVRSICEEIGQPMAAVALAWLLAQDGVTSVTAGIRSPEQARQNALGSEIELSDDILARLAEATEPVKAAVGLNADMWQVPSRMER